MKKEFKLPVVAALTVALTAPTMVYAAYPDVMEGKWYTAAIENAVSNNLLSGYEDGTMRPDNSITRAEIAAVFAKAFGAPEKSTLRNFNDVNSAQWFYNAMAKAVNMKVFVGDDQNCLNPSKPITRQEAAIVIAKAFELSAENGNALDKFADKAEVSPWAAPFLAALVDNGYMAGDTAGKLNPQGNITRAEFAQIMSNITNDYLTAESTVEGTYEGNVVVRDAKVALKNVTINGDLILADGLDESNFTLENVTITGNLVIRGGKTINLKGTKIGGKVITRNHNNTTRLEGDPVEEIVVNTPVAINLNCPQVTVNGSDLTVSGTGKVTTVDVNGNNVKVTILGANVVAAEGTTGVKAGSAEVPAGESEIVKGTTGGGGGSGVTTETMEVSYVIETVEKEDGVKVYELTAGEDNEKISDFTKKKYKVTVKVDGTTVNGKAVTIKNESEAIAYIRDVLLVADPATLANTIDAEGLMTKENYEDEGHVEALKSIGAVLFGDEFQKYLDAEAEVLAREEIAGDYTKVKFADIHEEYVAKGGDVDALITRLLTPIAEDEDGVYLEVLKHFINVDYIVELINNK